MRTTFIIQDKDGNGVVKSYDPNCDTCHGQKMVRVAEELKGLRGKFGDPKLTWCKCVRDVEPDKVGKLLFKCQACGEEDVREGAPADACCKLCGGKLKIIGDGNEMRKTQGQSISETNNEQSS